MIEDELSDPERRALDAWEPMAPPPGFADRVLAARDTPVVEPTRRRRGAWIVAGAAACVAAGAALWLTRSPSHAAHGELVATSRTTRVLGDRAVAVAEPRAALTWTIDDDGDASIDQRSGDVFYRVDKGGAFVVHTPAGDIRVTGTCFRIEVDPMSNRTKLILSGLAGAAIASGVLITVYEGNVIAESRGTRTEISAGNRATLTPDGISTVAMSASDSPSAPVDQWSSSAVDASTTREQLVARMTEQRSQIAQLQARLNELQKKSGDVASGELGRDWHDPSAETLAEWAKECHVRADEPGFDNWEPWTSLGKNERGLEPSELPHFNAAMSEVQQEWKQLLRALYVETTGDVTGADSLSIDAMRSEIRQKSGDDRGLTLQRLASERAGLTAPPADLSKLPPYERMLRMWLQLGDRSEAALAKRIGPERAAAIRGDAWPSRSDMSGCPSE